MSDEKSARRSVRSARASWDAARRLNDLMIAGWVGMSAVRDKILNTASAVGHWTIWREEFADDVAMLIDLERLELVARERRERIAKSDLFEGLHVSDWSEGEHPMSDEARRQRDAMLDALDERWARAQARSGRPDRISIHEIPRYEPDGGRDGE